MIRPGVLVDRLSRYFNWAIKYIKERVQSKNGSVASMEVKFQWK